MNKNTPTAVNASLDKPHRGGEMLEEVLVFDVVDIDAVVVV